ncbi:hypothetical protein PRUPE_8G084600, partial [Prunus persica]
FDTIIRELRTFIPFAKRELRIHNQEKRERLHEENTPALVSSSPPSWAGNLFLLVEESLFFCHHKDLSFSLTFGEGIVLRGAQVKF